MLEQITFVLITCPRDFDIAIGLTLFSINAFCSPEIVKEILVIVPMSSMTQFEEQFEKAKLNNIAQLVKIVDETTIIADISGIPKYRLQMALKLQCAKIIKTDFYITLDSDVYLTGDLNNDVLFPEIGKMRINVEPTTVHPKWWSSSSKVLNIPVPLNGIGVTPSALYTPAVCILIETINVPQIFKTVENCTEYSLYWLFFDKHFQKRNYYVRHALMSDRCVWYKDQYTTKQSLEKLIEKQFNNAIAPFSLLQSNLKIPHQAMISIVQNQITLKLKNKFV